MRVEQGLLPMTPAMFLVEPVRKDTLKRRKDHCQDEYREPNNGSCRGRTIATGFDAD